MPSLLFEKPLELGYDMFVDDEFCDIKSSVIDDFHHHSNLIFPNIKFTLELDDNSSLAFSDVRANRTANCELWTTIHHKPTHSDRNQ